MKFVYIRIFEAWHGMTWHGTPLIYGENVTATAEEHFASKTDDGKKSVRS